MTEREKCAHLLRKLGLGVTLPELDACEKRGVKGTIDWLIDYEKTPETTEYSPWPFAYDEPGKVNMDVRKFAGWFTLRLAATERPLEANMLIFWHNHFAVSGSKITFGPMMVDYTEVLKKHATGNFRKFLGEISRDPAMVRWLDTDTNIKGRPNENWARELFELFTLGVGNYTEKDIQEATKAFTGWFLRPALPEQRGMTQEMQLKLALSDDRPMVVFADSPALHDRTTKTVFGKSGPFEADDVLDLAVQNPAHPKFLMAKLWEYMVYPEPDAKLVDRLAKVYVDARYEIKPVLRWIANSKEFWSDKAVRGVVKSPAHYTLALVRQLGSREILKAANLDKCTKLEPVEARLRQFAGGLAGVMNRQGMLLLFPPDVAGWNWGTAWITTASVIERNKIGTYMVRGGSGYPARIAEMAAQKQFASTADAVNWLVEVFDVPAKPETRTLLIELFDKNGGIAALTKVNTVPNVVQPFLRMAAAIPEYQMN